MGDRNWREEVEAIGDCDMDPADLYRIALEMAAEIERLRGRMEAISDIAWDAQELDPEHQIVCHADTLPDAYRKACAAIEKVLAVVCQEPAMGDDHG